MGTESGAPYDRPKTAEGPTSERPDPSKSAEQKPTDGPGPNPQPDPEPGAPRAAAGQSDGTPSPTSPNADGQQPRPGSPGPARGHGDDQNGSQGVGQGGAPSGEPGAAGPVGDLAGGQQTNEPGRIGKAVDRGLAGAAVALGSKDGAGAAQGGESGPGGGASGQGAPSSRASAPGGSGPGRGAFGTMPQRTPPGGKPGGAGASGGDASPFSGALRLKGAQGTGEGGKATVGDDVKRTAKATKQGAEIGTKLGGGGIGTGVGAAVGAGLGLAGSKRGRILILLSLFSTPICIGLSIVMIVVIVSSAFGGGVSADAATQKAVAASAATTDGLADEQISNAMMVGDLYDVPWEIIGAIPFVLGNDATAEPDGYTADEQQQAIDNDEPVGPYGLIYNKAQKFAHSHNMPPIKFEDMADGSRAGPWVSRAVAEEMTQTGADETGIDAGVVGTDDPDDPDSYAFSVGASDNDQEAAGESRSKFIDALSALPIDDAKNNATRIYDTAFAWHLGQATSCSTGVTAVATSGWSNPVIGTLVSPYGMRVHPITGEYKLHDGQDISAPEGTTVYAASAGTVTLMPPNVAYGAHLIMIDHGNGVQTLYGHMEANLVDDGAVVSAGTPIGKVGTEGYSTGYHLHFGVWVDGSPIDPVPFMTERGVNLGVDDPTKPSSAVTGTTGSAPEGGMSGSQVRITHANIPMRSNDFRGSLAKVVSSAPDFVSLNEVSGRSDAELTRPGYALWRTPRAVAGVEGDAILYRTDRWTETAHGRVLLLADGPQAYDHDRGAEWVTLQSADAGTVSFISTHMMVNPAKYGPNKPLRQQLYRDGMEKLQDLVRTLSASGPVFVAGDMNSQYTDNDPWGPRKMLGEVGLRPVMDKLGTHLTHHGGGIIDYLMYQESAAAPTRQWFDSSIASDHYLLGAEFDLTGTTGGATPVSTGPMPSTFTVHGADGQTFVLDQHQLQYAAAIAQEGATEGISDDGIIVSFMTVFQESKFAMYANDGKRGPEDYGSTDAQLHQAAESLGYPHDAVGTDHSSVGLFQQQVFWGPMATLMDPAGSAGLFFKALKGVPGWESMSKSAAAQAVQHSAFPDAYANWEQAATDLLNAVKGTAVDGADDCPGSSTGVTGGGWGIGTLNLLGAGHTDGSGAHSKHGYASWSVRLPKELDLIQSAGVSIAGLQEVHPEQFNALKSTYSSDWDMFPKENNHQEVIIWDPTQWSMVDSQTVILPYFYGDEPSPLVELQSTSGDKVWVWSVHNPANARGPALDKRIESLRREVAKITEMKSAGVPILLVGDFNDRKDGSNRSMCALTPLMDNAFGDGVPPCGPPPRDAPVDHIYSTGLTMTGATVDRSTQSEKISDHPFVYAFVGTGADPSAGGPAAQKAIAFAMAQRGDPYVYGATGPNSWDCSGLMLKAWASAGVSLPRTSADQSKVGEVVNRADIQPGDLVFYYSPVSHVGMYIGHGQIIHAPHTGAVVRTEGVDTMPITVIRRVSQMASGGTA